LALQLQTKLRSTMDRHTSPSGKCKQFEAKSALSFITELTQKSDVSRDGTVVASIPPQSAPIQVPQPKKQKDIILEDEAPVPRIKRRNSLPLKKRAYRFVCESNEDKENVEDGTKGMEARLLRTRCVLYKRDEHGNCYSVDGGDGDEGYGSHSVPGGNVRNPDKHGTTHATDAVTVALTKSANEKGISTIELQSAVPLDEKCTSSVTEESSAKAVSVHAQNAFVFILLLLLILALCAIQQNDSSKESALAAKDSANEAMDSSSKTPSSLRYLDPAVLSALTNRAFKFNEATSRNMFAFGSSSMWSAATASTNWSPTKEPNIASGAIQEPSKETSTWNILTSSHDKRALEKPSSLKPVLQNQGSQDAPSLSTKLLTLGQATRKARRSLDGTRTAPTKLPATKKPTDNARSIESDGASVSGSSIPTCSLTENPVSKAPLRESTVVISAFNPASGLTETLATIPFTTTQVLKVPSKRSSDDLTSLSSSSRRRSGSDKHKKKKRRIMRISESKQSDTPIVMNKTMSRSCVIPGVVTEPSKVVRPDGSAKDDLVWMSEHTVPQGLVQREELPPIKAMPEGNNPWEHLWKPDATPFELKVVVCAERRSVCGLY
jgi:hypothetical protein